MVVVFRLKQVWVAWVGDRATGGGGVDMGGDGESVEWLVGLGWRLSMK